VPGPHLPGDLLGEKSIPKLAASIGFGGGSRFAAGDAILGCHVQVRSDLLVEVLLSLTPTLELHPYSCPLFLP
jgi:hypothetical protein